MDYHYCRWSPVSIALIHFADHIHELKSANEELQNQTHQVRVQQLQFGLKLNLNLLQKAKVETPRSSTNCTDLQNFG